MCPFGSGIDLFIGPSILVPERAPFVETEVPKEPGSLAIVTMLALEIVIAAPGAMPLKPSPSSLQKQLISGSRSPTTLTFPGENSTLHIDHLWNRLTMEKDKSRKKAEMVPGTLDMLILKTLE